MSAFGNEYEKNHIVEEMISYKNSHPEITHSQLVKEIMEAVMYGLEQILWEEEKNE